MKKLYFLLFVLAISAVSFAQKKEKIKGSKIVTVTQKEVEPFENLEIEDNLEIFIIKGDKQSLEIEADDNLHDVLKYEMNGNSLRLSATKDVSGAKKFSVRVTYTDNLKLITVRGEAQLNSLADLQGENITVKNYDYSKSYLNVKVNHFTLIMNDKTKAELNAKSQSVTLELSKNAEIKTLVTSQNLKIDLYQKTSATIEGDAATAKIRLDNNSNLTAKKLTAADMELVAESYSNVSVNATKNISITAAGKSEIQLFGEPKINMIKFSDNATLYKKQLQ
ncbi:GIN domain-containing protein [Flavobacterium pedocola]